MWCKEHWLLGDLCPDPETPERVTLGNSHPFPGLLCPTYTVQDWGAKGLCNHGLWGFPTAPHISSSENFPKLELPLLEVPSGCYFTIIPKA